MMVTVRTILLRASLLVLFTVPLAAANSTVSSAQFDPLGSTCFELKDDGTPVIRGGKKVIKDNLKDSVACNEAANQDDATNPISSEDGIIIRAANFIAIVTAVVAVIIIVIAGLTMVLSSGDSGKVASSRDAIIYAAVGLVIIALARSIVVFVINRI